MRRPARLAWFAAGAVVAVLAAAPPGRPRPGGPVTIPEIVAELAATGLAGEELVDATMATVARAFPVHTVWSLWESPRRALANGRGWSHQYNTVLRDVLRGLGFRARLVHAARVHGWPHPWFFASHAWVKVESAGRWRDACSSRTTNRLGDLGFTPVTDEMPYRSSTRCTVALGLAPFVVAGILRSRITGSPLPSWILHEAH